ncbi:gp83 putative HNH endonuclease [Iodobacter phage PhiPLPE]|uniref:Gp83 putative HNH endonuclease n=1 Tax=Iodobacter phage PhiPLPE TaxID=551895 RepID=B5AXA2_9CAUD|nr:gp83 putative HNH endonuclease [Iodobacter phage PhiPLPE]ACG60405.1 gp83 putative HNH endonuclease [Iodobacter phage PhiPLPE]
MTKPSIYDAVTRLEKIASPLGISVTLKDQAAGHIQLKGVWVVNYYPCSKNKTAYIKGTVKGYANTSEEKAVSMASEQPPVAPCSHKTERSKSGRYGKYKRWRVSGKRNHCRWCKAVLTYETATLEHVVPLNRGGLDCESNWDIACLACNTSRGNGMPELTNPACT